MENPKSYSKLKLKMFKKNIESKLQKISDDMNDLKDNMETRAGSPSGSQESVYSVHMAEAGTDSYEKEKGFQLMNRESDYYKSLTKGLERIEDGSFGVCTVCGELIPEERMMEVPNTTKRVQCKEKEKLKLG
jgi:RNA polymerase-binding transcription factor DksA